MAIAIALAAPPAAIAIYVAGAVVWLIPDHRIERVAAPRRPHQS